MHKADDYVTLGKVTGSPAIFPITGFLAGISLWVLDAVIDVYVLGEGKSIMEDIFSPEPREIWMRTLVVIVLIGMGILGHRVVLKHQRLDSLLINYQKKLKAQVQEKTEELQIKNDLLEELATKDPLTGLYNRRYFLDILDNELMRISRHGRPFCLLLLDIDHFKKINDLHGHYTGDAVLNAFGQQTLSALRREDCLARWGGEEFILLAPETNIGEAGILAEKLRHRIAEYVFGDIGQVTVSIGIAEALPDEPRENLIRRADHALYSAKKFGRNRVEIALSQYDSVQHT